MSVIDHLWRGIGGIFKAVGVTEVEERGIAMSALYEQVWLLLSQIDESAWLNELYIDDVGTLNAIFSLRGMLYKAPVIVLDGTATLGAMTEVQVEYTPRERGLSIQRQADGTYRWFAITETCVLLRVGEIDSKALFDSLVANIATDGYPVLRFFHEGTLDFGVADWASREGNCLLASGTMEAKWAEALLRSMGEGNRWGTSNGFEPTRPAEMWEVTEGLQIPVYQEGVWREISVLPENRAASWFTDLSVQPEVMRMRKEVADKLRELFGDAAESMIDNVDTTNRDIDRSGMIVREETVAEAVVVEDTPAVPVVPEAVTESPTTEYVVEEDLLTVIEERLAKMIPDVGAMVSPIAEQVRTLGESLGAALTEVRTRLDALEVEDDQKRETWTADLPRKRVEVTYRPRQANEQEPRKRSSAEIAAETLAQLK
jgi:hypothetical protein